MDLSKFSATFERIGDWTLAAYASKLGLVAGRRYTPHFPNTVFIDGLGTFTLEQILRDGARLYRRGASKFTFTIYNA